MQETHMQKTVYRTDNRAGSRQKDTLAADLIKGAVAGAVGVWAMDQVGWKMYLNEDPKAFKQEKEAQVEGKYSAHVMVGKLANAAGTDPSDEQQYRAGKAAHYMLGMMPGAAYSVLRKRVDGVGAGRGLLYGLGVFVLEDELVNPLLGFASGPSAYPWQAHARGLVTHLVLGLVTHTALDVLDQVA
jgi:uncharacterized membrane protein YagU involved in acid resistance